MHRTEKWKNMGSLSMQVYLYFEVKSKKKKMDNTPFQHSVSSFRSRWEADAFASADMPLILPIDSFLSISYES